MSKQPSLPLLLALLGSACSGPTQENPTAPVAPAPPEPVADSEPNATADEEELSLGQIGLVAGHSSAAPEGKIDHAQAELSITGALDRELVFRIIEDHIAELEYCYSSGTQVDLVGEAKIRFVISNTGEVALTAVEEVTAGGEQLARCVARTIRRWHFPKPKGEGVVLVDYPLRFAPG